MTFSTFLKSAALLLASIFFGLGCSRVEFSDIPEVAQQGDLSVDNGGEADGGNGDGGETGGSGSGGGIADGGSAGSGNGGGNGIGGGSGDTVVETASQEFTTFAGNGDLDLLWMVDNSGSMAEEAAHVRSNFARFSQFVGERTNLKLSLISAPVRWDTDKGVDMPLGLSH